MIYSVVVVYFKTYSGGFVCLVSFFGNIVLLHILLKSFFFFSHFIQEKCIKSSSKMDRSLKESVSSTSIMT